MERIVADPKICGGQACVRGTRVPVHVVLDYLAAGESIESVLENFPQLQREDILACLTFASRLARDEFEPIIER